jgi:uncharacterized protein
MLEVRVFLDEDDLHEGKRTYEHIMRYLMHHGISGATMFSAVGGFGHRHHLNFPRRIGATDEGPIMILFIDEETKVRSVIPHLKEVVREGLIVMNQVEHV